MMNGKQFKSKVVVISGGADGVGRAASLMFAEEGASVAILDIQADKGEETASEIRSLGGEAVFFPTDSSVRAQVEVGIAGAIKKYGKIDVLFNHAGTVIVKPFLETTPVDWDRLMAINVSSMFHCCQVVLPHMLDRAGGVIVNTASVSGLSASSLEVAYCVSKGACIQLTRAIAVEFRDNKIRCNAVCPALIRTAHGVREAKELVALGQPWSEDDVAAAQGRICEPEEVANAVLFLASDAASFINGEMLVVDNGQMART